ncbi:MAG: pyridoxal-dependent decarboxylase, partial [Saprospiraceae bacterium]|nr:pyridoxal-dependent decarboxylase [Saprospiraceae bacterium]
MRDQIVELERTARQLHTSPQQRAQWNSQLTSYTESFLHGLPDGKAYENHDTSQQLYDIPISESGHDMDALLALLKTSVDTPGINPASGGHLGYIPGGGLFPSALGDMLADVTNRYAGVYFANPGAVRMENMLIRWMCEMIGYPETSHGNLTSGGSIANLIGITTARDALHINAARVAQSVI